MALLTCIFPVVGSVTDQAHLVLYMAVQSGIGYDSYGTAYDSYGTAYDSYGEV